MKKNKSFTMAEILISLTIIGVIAALTLPALMANLNEKVWNTKRKALHSRMAQALAAMPNLDKYLEADGNSAAYNFINNGLATTLNITKVCDEDNMAKCDFDLPVFLIDDSEFDRPDTIVSFNTINGESIGVEYNPSCNGSNSSDVLTSEQGSNMICANFIYDLNGASKGPNKVGRDMGLIVAYFPEYPLVVAPMPVVATEGDVNAEDAEDLMSENPDFRLPSPAEALVLTFYGRFFAEYLDGYTLWTDNNRMCAGDNCTESEDVTEARLVLVSKNGDAPKNFKIISESNE